MCTTVVHHTAENNSQWRQRELKVGGDEPCEPTVRLPDWSELVASYSRMKSAWGWANGGQQILVCYIRKYVIILGGDIPVDVPSNQNIGGDVSPASSAGLTPVLWFFKDILSDVLSAVSIHFRKQSNRLHRMFCGSAWLEPEMHFNPWKKNFVIYILSTICHWPALMGFYFLTSLASCQCTSLLLLLLFWYMTNKFFFFFNITYKPTNRHHHHQHHHIKLISHDKRVCLSILATYYRVLSIYWTTCNKRTCKLWL